MLEEATASGVEVRIGYVGLEGAERHIARVHARVAAGGHDIPASKIRERYRTSRVNLIRLQKVATEVRVFDNTEENDPAAGRRPVPHRRLHEKRGKVVTTCPLEDTPAWAKPILAAALRSWP